MCEFWNFFTFEFLEQFNLKFISSHYVKTDVTLLFPSLHIDHEFRSYKVNNHYDVGCDTKPSILACSYQFQISQYFNNIKTSSYPMNLINYFFQ